MPHINFLLVFLEGVLSLLSPCVLPILPVYLSILSNSSVDSLKSGEVKFFKSPLFRNTILFVLGIATTFFILGSSISVLNSFLKSYKSIVLIFGGVIIIFMGIFYMGFINIPILQREKRINIQVKSMRAITAYMLGFTFSFGWTPCIGPMLSSVLLMASTSKNILEGNLLILLYTMGFILPFVIISAFYSKLFKVIEGIKLHLDMIKKIGGVVLVISGVVMIVGAASKTNSYIPQNDQNTVEQTENIEKESNKESENEIKSIDFTLEDQYGNKHTLSDYEGKVVFLNFWATWCPPCKEELPHIEELYNENEKNSKDVVILTVAAPNLGREGSKEDIRKFLDENKYTFPVGFDNDAFVMSTYAIEAFPTTFIIDKKGNIDKYIPGALDKKTMEYLIDQVK